MSSGNSRMVLSLCEPDFEARVVESDGRIDVFFSSPRQLIPKFWVDALFEFFAARQYERIRVHASADLIEIEMDLTAEGGRE
jgi:hypothetical protein